MKRDHVLILAAAIGGLVVYSLTKWTVPKKGQKYIPLFQQAEYTYGLPPRLLAKMAHQESNFDPNAVSKAGAQGIMQIVPKWHPTADPFNVPHSINYAGALMRKHYNRFGNWFKALAAYNAGPNKLASVIKNHGVNWLANMPQETQNYVARIGNDVL